MKILVIVLSIFVLSGTLAIPINNKDDSVDNYIRSILELLKVTMPNGIPDLGIPPLDPFEVPHFEIDHISTSGVEADITIDDVVVKNLATFEIRKVHADVLDLKLELELFIPLLRADGVYSLDGTIFSLLPLYGNGDMYIELTGLTLNANPGIKIDTEGFMQVTSLALGADFEGIVLHLDNLLGGGDFGETINNLLSVLGPQIWDLVDDELFKIVNEALLGLINNELKKCTVEQIVNQECHF